MAARPLFALISMILVAGAIVLTFFVLLAGAINDNPVNKFYFLSADTSDITGAPAESRWTFWNVCGTTSNGRNDCGKVHPAYPFNPPSNFGTKTNVPQQFIGTKEYYYLTRFMFAFDLIYLFFAVCSLAVGLLALCTRIGSYLAGLFAMIAAFFSVLTAALMTAAYVKGRNNFISNDQTAHLGKYAFGFMWAAFFCLFVASILYCTAGAHKTETTYTKRSFFGRRTRSTRSRGSFLDADRKEFA